MNFAIFRSIAQHLAGPPAAAFQIAAVRIRGPRRKGKTMRLKTIIALLFAVLIMTPALALAQEQKGSIEGIVKDQQGAAVPGATVEAKSAGGVVLTTTSDSNGQYRFPAVSLGMYEVTAKLTGFKLGKVDNVQVTIASVKKVDFSLQVGNVSEQVS